MHAIDLGGRGGAADDAIWSRAAAEGLVILMQDRDFIDLVRERGHPPKVVLLRGRNQPTASIAERLVAHLPAIHAFLADRTAGLLEID